MNKTGIPYLDRAWNPVRGCSHCGPACDNCYAEAVAKRFCHEPHQRNDLNLNTSKIIPAGPYSGFATTSGWTGRVELVPEKLVEPLRSRKPQRVGVCFTSDLFHEALPDEAIDRVVAMITLCRQHTFVLLTKRWERMYEYFDHPLREIKIQEAIESRIGVGDAAEEILDRVLDKDWRWPLSNVWLGISAWDQSSLNAAAGWLDKTPAAVKWISLEPQLGPVTFRWAKWKQWNPPGTSTDHLDGLRRFSWVVQGCESGPKRRPFYLDWARTVRDECQEAGIAYYLKQAAVNGCVVEHPELDGRAWRELPDGENVA